MPAVGRQACKWQESIDVIKLLCQTELQLSVCIKSTPWLARVVIAIIPILLL